MCKKIFKNSINSIKIKQQQKFIFSNFLGLLFPAADLPVHLAISVHHFHSCHFQSLVQIHSLPPPPNSAPARPAVAVGVGLAARPFVENFPIDLGLDLEEGSAGLFQCQQIVGVATSQWDNLVAKIAGAGWTGSAAGVGSAKRRPELWEQQSVCLPPPPSLADFDGLKRVGIGLLFHAIEHMTSSQVLWTEI